MATFCFISWVEPTRSAPLPPKLLRIAGAGSDGAQGTRAFSEPSAIEERLATIRSEFDHKIRDLDVRYALTVRVRVVAAERITMPIVQGSCNLRWKRTDRTLPIVWNPVLHDLEPLACDGCGAASRDLVVSEQLEIRCADCAKRAG